MKDILRNIQKAAAQKPMLSESLWKRRCILPAERFYEWDARKQKATFTSSSSRC